MQLIIFFSFYTNTLWAFRAIRKFDYYHEYSSPHQRKYFSTVESKLIFKPIINNSAPPILNPNKSQINSSNMSASNVTIYQEYKTDMTINGTNNPQASADAL